MSAPETPASADLMPMCCVGRVYVDWMNSDSPCNRRATVGRAGGYYCRKHDPVRIRATAARRHESEQALRLVADSALLREAKRRGLM